MSSVIDRTVRGFQKRLNQEVLGAWRAGYDYLHYFEPVGQVDTDNLSYSLGAAVLPSNDEQPPGAGLEQYRYVRTYVLHDVRPEEVRKFRSMDTTGDYHQVKQSEIAWWKPVVHQAAEHVDCETCEERLQDIATEMQEVIDRTVDTDTDRSGGDVQ